MKKNIFILIFVLVTNFGFSQDKSNKFLPVLFDTAKVDIKYKRKRIEIKDALLLDSLKIVYKVALEFKYPLSNIFKPVIISSVKLINLDIKSLTTKKQYSINLFEKNKWSIYYGNIWYRYSKLFNYWYRNQPYNKMIDRESYGNKVYFGGVLYVSPR
jgi:hypothetical protein